MYAIIQNPKSKIQNFFILYAVCLLPFPAFAQGVSYIEEVRALGAVSGQGMACGSSKYDNFELLARAILITKATSDQQQAEGMKKYNEEKANAYMSKQLDGFYECAAINNSFDKQDIFKATLYADGTIKMPDGKILTPRQPYDATMVYNKKSDEKITAQKIYDGGGNQKVEVTVKDDRIGAALPQAPATGAAPIISQPSQPLESSVKRIKGKY